MKSTVLAMSKDATQRVRAGSPMSLPLGDASSSGRVSRPAVGDPQARTAHVIPAAGFHRVARRRLPPRDANATRRVSPLGSCDPEQWPMREFCCRHPPTALSRSSRSGRRLEAARPAEAHSRSLRHGASRRSCRAHTRARRQAVPRRALQEERPCRLGLSTRI